MRTVKQIGLRLGTLAALIALIALAGCVSTKPVPEKAIGIDTSAVYRLGQAALKPIAEKYIDKGDRILLAPVSSFSGVTAWRFVPTPQAIPQDVFEKEVKPKVASTFKAKSDGLSSETPEMKQLTKAFTLDSNKKEYAFKPGFDGYDEALLGRALAAAGYSGVAPVALADFIKANPYFIDSLESGMLAAVLARQARGFERLAWTDRDSKREPASESRDVLEKIARGRMVFGTDPLAASSWKELQDSSKPNPSQKLLMYSIDSMITDESGYIGFSLSLRLVDMAGGGKVLWSGSQTLTSDDFPGDKKPSLGTTTLTIPADAAAAAQKAVGRAMRDQGIKVPASAALVKVDDAAVFGALPVTREDFAVEAALEALFGGVPGLTVVEKLFKRNYKEPWQLANAVAGVNPFQGGDYSEFQNYYGARFMISYRVMWKDQQGVRRLEQEGSADLAGRALGVYAKMIDMSQAGKIVASVFIPVLGSEALQKDVLYRCYSLASGFSALGAGLNDTGAIGPALNVALVNRRMEIANLYLMDGAPASPSLPENFAGVDQGRLMRASFEAYAALRKVDQPPAKPEAKQGTSQSSQADKPATLDAGEELNMYAAICLMQSWFEDGLVTALVDADANVFEKLESLYSRSMVAGSAEMRDRFLSPLLVGSWGPMLKKYYNLDRVVYFAFLDTRTPAGNHFKVPEGSPLARYFPVVNLAPDSMQVSVVNLATGDYEFKRDFSIE